MSLINEKIYKNNKIKSFHNLDLNIFSDDELRYLKLIYFDYEDKIDKFIDKRKYSNMDKKFLEEQIELINQKIKHIEDKTFIFVDISEEDDILHDKLINILSKLENDFRKASKYK